MKITKLLYVLPLVMICLNTTSCRRQPTEVWEDTKSAGNYMGKGMRTLGGKHGDSRMVSSPDDFYPDDDVNFAQDDFVPLQDDQGNDMVNIENARQARETPGGSWQLDSWY